MTYESMKLNDHEILDVMYMARRLGITTMVHAENADMINWMTEHLEAQGMTAPYYHGTSRPPIVEAEAVVSLGLTRSGSSKKDPVLTNMVEPCDLTRGAHGYTNSTRPCVGEPGHQAH